MSAAHFKTAPFLPGAWWDALRCSSFQWCYRPTDHGIRSPKQLQTCPSHRLWAACCSWDTNCTISEQPFIWGSSFLKAFPILLKNQQVSFSCALLYTSVMHISDEGFFLAALKKRLRGCSEANQVLHGFQSQTALHICWLQLPCSLEHSLIHCNSCNSSLLKLWQICWIYPAVTQPSFPFRIGFAWGLFLFHVMHQLCVSDLTSSKIVQQASCKWMKSPFLFVVKFIHC